jgi:outer membrane protein OmpA-like peptidoglycan-associated protein
MLVRTPSEHRPLRAGSLLLTLAVAGCASQTSLAERYADLERDVQSIHALSNCAPRDLALADANYEFARIEFDQGNTRRASEHIEEARRHVQIVRGCAPLDVAPPKAPEKVVEKPAPAPKNGDQDADGVTDNDDNCPRDAEDLDGYKDLDGCPELDNDGDGVMDTADKCPNEPEDRDGFADTDGCPELDNDSDGLADAQDQCPNEAGPVAGKGCPSKDADSDGVNDDTDKCPTAPETRNDYLDEDGCPDTKPQRIEVTGNQIVIKQRINFATGKATILSDSFPVLDDVAQVLKDYPNIHVEIGGHTDNVGEDGANQRLSKSRADAVFEYLIAHGVRADRLVTVGYGETRPIDTNMTDAGKLANRRVEFMILDAAAKPAPAAPEPEPASPW